MRAQCCICADLFEYSQAGKIIAAAPCGHTFHEECLMRWMGTSSTCPSCRTHIKKNQVIKRLFFDICETEEGDAGHTDEEVCRLSNEVGNLKTQVRVTEKERDVLAQRFVDCDQEKNEHKKKLLSERNMNDVLRRDFSLLQRDRDTLAEGMKDFKATVQRLEKLQNVDTVLKGCDSDIQAMISSYSEGGEASLKHLCSLASVMKREYTQALADKRLQKDQMAKLKAIVSRQRSETEKTQRELKESQARLEEANESLSKAEQENNQNRRKVAHLRTALRHNVTDGSESFLSALNEDSPNVAYTPPKHPKMSSTPLGRNPRQDYGMGYRDNFIATPTSTPSEKENYSASPDLFESSVEQDRNESDDEDNIQAQMRFRGQPSPKLKFVKLPSASDKFMAAKRARLECSSEDAPPAPVLSIMRKKLTGVGNSRTHVGSVSRQGYDGFGGTTTFVQPFGVPKGALMKLAGKGKKVLASKNKNIGPPSNQPKLTQSLSPIEKQSSSSSSSSLFSSSSSSISSTKKSSSTFSTSSTSDLWKGPFSFKGKKTFPTKSVQPKLSGASCDLIDLTD